MISGGSIEWRQRREQLDQGIVGGIELGLCVAACCAATVALALAFGRDLNWDFFNYHLYAGLSLAQGRLDRDFMAAGYQGYMNPAAYLPFYLMVSAKWHSMVIASVIAAVQSLNFVFLYLISRRLIGQDRHGPLVAALLTALGACSGAVLGQLGSSFIDFTISWPVMAAIWLLLLPTNASRTALCGGLVGICVGLKLTNIVFLVGLVAAALVLPAEHWRQTVRRVAWLGLGATAGVAVSSGYWLLRLQHEFGSPFFPMFNDFFKAPDFPAERMQYQRFVPQTLLDALLLPFRLVDMKSWQYVETQAPDLRPAVLVAVVAWMLIGWLAKRSKRNRVEMATDSNFNVSKTNGLLPLSVFTSVASVAWMLTSANGRYASPILLLLGPLIYLCLGRILSRRVAIASCFVLLVLQTIHTAAAGNPHWAPTYWSDEWLPSKIPKSISDTPFLFVTIGLSSESYIAAFVHPQSEFVNPIGLLSIRTGGPGWRKFQSLLDSHQGKIQLVFPEGPTDSTPEQMDAFTSRRNALVDRLGLRFAKAHCQTMVFNERSLAASDDLLPGRSVPRRVQACLAERLAKPSEKLATERAQAEQIMNLIEDHCPAMLSPHRAQVEGNGTVWARIYGKYDILLSINAVNSEVAFHMEHQNVDTLIGHVDSIARDVDKMTCKLPHNGVRGM